MPVKTITTDPTLIFHSSLGDTGRPTSIGIQIKNGVTGTVYLAKNPTECVVDETNYITENTSIYAIDLKAGQEIWGVVGSGSVDVVFSTYGAE